MRIVLSLGTPLPHRICGHTLRNIAVGHFQEVCLVPSNCYHLSSLGALLWPNGGTRFQIGYKKENFVLLKKEFALRFDLTLKGSLFPFQFLELLSYTLFYRHIPIG